VLSSQGYLKEREPDPKLRRESDLEADSAKDWKSLRQASAVLLLLVSTNETRARRKPKLLVLPGGKRNAALLVKGPALPADIIQWARMPMVTAMPP